MKKVLIWIGKFLSVLLLPILLFAILHLFAPDTVTTRNIPSLLKQAIAPAILGWGVLFNIKAGNWDFAVGSEVLLASIIGGNLAIRLNLSIPGLILCCCIVGLLCGSVVGVLYYLLKIPTIIVSIGMLLIYESAAGIVFQGNGVKIPSEWVVFGTFPYNFIALLVVGVIAYLLNYNTRFGLNIRAVGSAANIAEANGIDAYKVKAAALMMVGLFGGFYATINLGMNGVARTVSSMGTMSTCFDAMMCVFVGMSLSYGTNLIVSIYLGSLFMQIIKLGFMVFGLPNQYNNIVIAIVVLVFMGLNNNPQVFERIKNIFARKKAVA